MKVIDIAKACHEVNRAYCEAIGDASQPKWEDAPNDIKESTTNLVTLHINNPDSTPESSHIAWFENKQKAGWKWGPEKNLTLKEHPCMVPYAELPFAQRIKDNLFVATVDSLKNLIT